MSSLSPNPTPSRLRTKTSDLTDFFRNTGPSSYPLPHKESSTSAALDVPSGDESSKKKITRIPLFGRARKKSNQSTNSSPSTTTNTTYRARDSADVVREPSSRVLGSSADRRPAASSSTAVPVPPLPTSSKIPSFSSKFAAHFSHRSPKVTAAQAEAKPALEAQQDSQSSGLAPPPARPDSFESSSSVGTKRRSLTPQPTRPAITVSLSTDNDDEEFKDLFTKPRPSKTVDKVKKQEQSMNPSPPATPRTDIAEPTYKRGRTPASAIVAAVRHKQTPSTESERADSTASSNSKQNSDSDKSHQSSGCSTPRLHRSPESQILGSSNRERCLPPSLQRRSTVASGHLSDSAVSLRSRMKAATQPPRRPPSIPLPIPPRPSGPPPAAPLPPTPTGSLPTPDSPNSPAPQYVRMVTEALDKTHTRPRAHTMGSSGDITLSIPQLSRVADSSRESTSSSPGTIKNGATLDIETASADELRRALKARNKDCESLADLLVKTKQDHAVQVTSLERKIADLEALVLEQKNKIKGFTLLIQGGQSLQQEQRPPKTVSSSTPSRSRYSANTDTNASDMEDTQRSSISGISKSRLNYQSDSGAESHATSGCESIRAVDSAAGSLTSMFRNKKLRRHYPASDTTQVSRSGTVVRSSKVPPAVNSEKNLPEIPSASSITKRSSNSSLYASPSSSTSSLLPPSPSVTMSSLSAIPEGSGSTLGLPRYEASEQQDDRRLNRASHRASTSSLASSATAASSSYSANIKRSRPPSIAQVLEESPETENVLDKLRPFT
ncbi:hypothetical protein CPC08DRAFT_763108 [Agrocybe pediades]|nr:hypothetical protein CPC08DRAFT_763108 [Agrocybe pediades]